ncbi:unnamed protein product [Bursaphelenchus xylophilus]|uniref:(pine wood nematode) hypothetical protein n=1 Tax=Bursaphelenchus xylophilus TaxID=6326 RepID=A0A7I8XB36_BURXY|nr:unnamed protein product [Bursaphelenchus xylophilus]CAG9083632.1 unnamed protein product [Bursaphelenchus xylophilus]
MNMVSSLSCTRSWLQPSPGQRPRATQSIRKQDISQHSNSNDLTDSEMSSSSSKTISKDRKSLTRKRGSQRNKSEHMTIGDSHQGTRLYMETTSSKLKQRPAFNLDTTVQYEDYKNHQPVKKPEPKREDWNQNWVESLRTQ